MRNTFWKKDWFVGGVVVVVILILHASTSIFDGLDSRIYDVGMRSVSQSPSDKVAVIAIDDQSIENLGRWPWPRDIQAKMIDKLNQAGAKVITSSVLWSESHVDPGLSFLQQIDKIAGPAPAPVVVASDAAATVATEPVEDPRWPQVRQVVAEANQKLNTDATLAASIKNAGNVVIPVVFETIGAPEGKPDKDLPDYIARNLMDVGQGQGGAFLVLSPQLPLPEFGKVATAIGAVVSMNDNDGVYRQEPAAVDYYGGIFPSLAVAAVAKGLNLQPQDIHLLPGNAIQIGSLNVPVDDQARMRPLFYKAPEGQSAFVTDSFFDVYTDKISMEKYRGKIVLIGSTAHGVGQLMPTPSNPRTTSVEILAHSISSILQQKFILQPGWGVWLNSLCVLLIALYLMFLLPRLKAGVAAGFSALILVTLVASSWGLMAFKLMWVPLMLPASLVLLAHLVITTFRFLTTERGKERSDAESAESNRMLGLAFQNQGQLDMAFDKFRKCPLDESMLDILYNLGLDFERKRQFNKSTAVLEYLSTFAPKFKDVEQRLKRSKTMEETVIFGQPTKGNSSTLAVDSQVEKPMLGRYQVEKELGKGAMGVVYLGKDPKISRVVAIKTMALSAEFDEEELEDVRARFFREAETAGRLNHPNIVTIYDAGEEHDLAYIAMEFLKGKDLVPHAKPANLLPLPDVLAIVRQVADALGYAHTQNVVHRDIKPANIMYEPESKSVKVTDFGIARITDSSRTKTGLVLGTPSYMSPEQLSGKKIDGRSDLFSLGVMLYQLCVGQLPFKGESMAELMFRIANEPHRNIRDINPDIPIALSGLINRALSKDPAQRFQTGQEFAEAIRQCEATIQPKA